MDNRDERVVVIDGLCFITTASHMRQCNGCNVAATTATNYMRNFNRSHFAARLNPSGRTLETGMLNIQAQRLLVCRDSCPRHASANAALAAARHIDTLESLSCQYFYAWFPWASKLLWCEVRGLGKSSQGESFMGQHFTMQLRNLPPLPRKTKMPKARHDPNH